MKKIITYIKDCYNELVHKVTWPTRENLTQSAVIVMIASIIMALIVMGIDGVFKTLLDYLYGLKG